MAARARVLVVTWPGAVAGLVVVVDVAMVEVVVGVVEEALAVMVVVLLLVLLLLVAFLCPGTGLLWGTMGAAGVGGVVVVMEGGVSALGSWVVAGGPAVAGAALVGGEVERVRLSSGNKSVPLDGCV